MQTIAIQFKPQPQHTRNNTLSANPANPYLTALSRSLAAQIYRNIYVYSSNIVYINNNDNHINNSLSPPSYHTTPYHPNRSTPHTHT